MTRRDREATPNEEHGLAAIVRGGLVVAGVLGLPLLALWTATGRTAGGSLPAIGAPWDGLVPLFVAAVFLLASVRWILYWAEKRFTGSPSREDPVRPARSRPCADCPP